MKKFAFFALAAMTALSVSCKKDAPVAPSEIDWDVPEEAVSAGKPVIFSDNTLDVQSRTWTFQEGTPASSTQSAVEVVFASKGEKTVTLEVVFTNGATLSKETKVTVVDPLAGEIAVSETTEKGCIKIGKEVTFSIADASGSPETYAWTIFGNGQNIATSTDATVKVTFTEHVRELSVSCKLGRADGAALELEEVYEVGNYTVNQTWPTIGYDGISFEGTVYPEWNNWREHGWDNFMSIANIGACGTAHSMKVDMSQFIEAYPAEPWIDIFSRNSWGTNAPKVEAGKKYELSFWMKFDNGTPIPIDPENTVYLPLAGLMIIANVEEYYSDVAFGKILENFKDVFGFDCEQGKSKALYENYWMPEGMALDNNWKHVVIPFTPDSDYYNVYPYFRACGFCDNIYFDEIEICLVEE